MIVTSILGAKVRRRQFEVNRKTSHLIRSQSDQAEQKVVSMRSESGQVTLMHLLLSIAFFMPLIAACGEIQNTGGGITRYLLAVPLSIMIGVIIVVSDWNMGKMLWMKSQQLSRRIQNATALALLVLEVLWIFVGAVSGSKLGILVARYINK
jgi:hypothetical protein